MPKDMTEKIDNWRDEHEKRGTFSMNKVIDDIFHGCGLVRYLHEST